MSVIYSIRDRIKLKVHNLEVEISPLSVKVKADIQALITSGKIMDASVVAMRNSIKSIKGLKNADGSEYVVAPEETGSLKEEIIDDLLNIPEGESLNIISLSLLQGIPKEGFIDAQTGKQLEGVRFVEKEVSEKK